MAKKKKISKKALADAIYRFNEVVADIAYDAGRRRHRVEDSRAGIALYIDLAQEFEDRYGAGVEWGYGCYELDYIEAIDAFCEEKFGKEKKKEDIKLYDVNLMLTKNGYDAYGFRKGKGYHYLTYLYDDRDNPQLLNAIVYVMNANDLSLKEWLKRAKKIIETDKNWK